MIPRTVPPWHQSLIDAFRRPEELAQYLEIEPSDIDQELNLNTGFPMLVPRGFADRMEKGNPQDPLLLQVMPSIKEKITDDNYCPDPLREADVTVAPGALQKYQGRVLLIATGACSIHCRYCFRRHFPYSDSIAYGTDMDHAVRYLKANRDITEVILSGGDPLMLSNSSLKTMIYQLDGIEHIQRLRIHSRMPVTLPERVDPEMANILGTSRFKIVFVIHCNHANELDQSVSKAITTLAGSGITLLNQSVLLRGINDSCEKLRMLSERLFSFGVLPYYLHMLDRVSGAMHFEVATESALAMHKHLQGSLPGYLVPRLVYEKAGAESKLLLS